MRFHRLLPLAAVLVVISSACPGSPGIRSSRVRRGGTLRVASVVDPSAALDPAHAYDGFSFELFRCCLVRTLFSTNGRELENGGSELRPDIAEELPEVSEDGLTWTIRLRQGLRYAPPFDDVEITAPDIVRALERVADPRASVGGYRFYYTVIDGFDEFGHGKTASISGLSTPDPHTLRVELTSPTGDLGWRLALPATSPIPPNRADPLGAAQGHGADYGRFLVASGPYMFEGADQIDYSVTADDRVPAAGNVPGRSIVLVRNPSWNPATDANRKAYADRIEITIGGDPFDLYTKLGVGLLDYVLAFPPRGVLRDYASDPELRSRLHRNPVNATSYTSLNLAVPPFDDVHVRRAVNWVFDKAGSILLAGGELLGTPAGHIFPDGLLDGVLEDYAPYATPGDHGDVDRARQEMTQSKYDTNRDGICDLPACTGVLALTVSEGPESTQAQLWRENLSELGIELDIKVLGSAAMFAKCNDLAERIAICLSLGWSQDYPDPYTFGPPLFGGQEFGALYPGCCNFSALGAASEQLEQWGYEVTSVPSVDGELTECIQIEEAADRTECWAAFDRLLMEEIVPWVPRRFPVSNEMVSARVTAYSFDAFASLVAFDRLAIAPAH